MYKGQIKGFPQEVVEKMLERQVEQGNERDVSVFEEQKTRGVKFGGFVWSNSEEGHVFWSNVIDYEDFDIFFEKHPKKELPRMVMVRDYDTGDWWERELLHVFDTRIENRFIVKTKDGYAVGYKKMKEIEAKPIPEYTIQELQDKIGEEFKLKK